MIQPLKFIFLKLSVTKLLHPVIQIGSHFVVVVKADPRCSYVWAYGQQANLWSLQALQSVTKVLHLFIQIGSHLAALLRSGFNVESIMIRSYPKLQLSVSFCSINQPLKCVLLYKVWPNYYIGSYKQGHTLLYCASLASLLNQSW